MMIDGDFNIQGGDTTNPSLELELKPVGDGSSLETRLDSASVHISSHSDNPTVVQAVEIEIESVGIDNISAERYVSDKNYVVKHVKCEQKKVKRGKELNAKDGDNVNGSVVSEDGFVVMDMVWAKVKSHPWWPGHVFSEKLATASVRRLKRDGLLLVAFFGDSSYGWFDPSELIPFDLNFGEKSRQTGSRSFVTAVEDALDEVSRRSALGLSCMCRSKQNFRRNEVEGYFSVDVVDYEPGGVYSVDVIEKARESFKPGLALDFVRRLALEPIGGGEYGGIDFIKNKAKVMAYRRAVYEEFDETYAQAFGYDPVHPSPVDIQEPVPQKTPSKAPLAFADSSSKGKSSGKPNKPKDHAKKHKCLFKQRDEYREVKADQKEKKRITSSPQLGHDDDVAVLAGEYGLQKREPTATTQDELASKDSTGTTAFQTIKNTVDDVDDNGIASRMDNRKTSSVSDANSSIDKKVVTQNDIPNSKPHKISASRKVEDSVLKKVKMGSKRPVGELGSGNSVLLKKRKKDQLLMSDGTGTVPLVHREKFPAKKPVESSISTNLPIENLHETADNKPITSHTSGTKDVISLVTELPQVLSYLHSLAHDPFRAINGGRLIKTRQTFLKFRSIVFQKSLNLSAPAENGEEPKPVVKPQATSLGRLDDPITGGRKRGLSDRQEEMAAKKKKKVDDIRNLTNEKKMKKLDEPHAPAPARDVKQPAAMAMKKPGLELIKKAEQRAPEPTMLMIKFPQGGSLPSINELKARFARYGPMDHSATRIYWKTLMCRVVYRNKSNAEAAYRFVVGSNSLFGNTDIKCNLKEFGVVGSAMPEPSAKVNKQGHNQPATSSIQPKSILKKSSGEEAAGNAGKRRVKFILNEENEVKNKNGASTFSSVHTTMDINSKNFQKFVPKSSSVPTTCVTSSTTRPPLSTSMHYESPLAQPLVSPRLPYGIEMATPPLPLPADIFVDNLQRPKEDISQQMLRLMTKCNAVVTNMTNVFGYVPYHLH